VNESILYTVSRHLQSLENDDPLGPLAAIAALADPLRRRLYGFVSRQEHAVGRDEAAAGVGISRSAAAFHLDRMVDDGLLEPEFRRLTGRQGPGAGRPSKLYRRARREIAFSLPVRQYELAADLLAAAVSEVTATGTPVAVALDRLARQRGAELAAAVERIGVAGALAGVGYEPCAGSCEIVLRNCPFAGVVADHADLICHMNLALLEGFVAALPDAGLTARLAPAEGACCVRLELAGP
jgi:predicted ArsR family transcriptional regulator